MRRLNIKIKYLSRYRNKIVDTLLRILFNEDYSEIL